MKKIIIVFLLFLLAMSAYIQDEKKVYETDTFSIKYPTHWTLQLETVTQALFAISAPKTSDTDIFVENVNLITQDLKGFDVGLEQYVDINKGQLNTVPNGKIFSIEKFKEEWGNYYILTFKGTMSNLDLKVSQLYAVKNEVAYVVTFTALENEFDKQKEIGLEILQSFKLK